MIAILVCGSGLIGATDISGTTTVDVASTPTTITDSLNISGSLTVTRGSGTNIYTVDGSTTLTGTLDIGSSASGGTRLFSTNGLVIKDSGQFLLQGVTARTTSLDMSDGAITIAKNSATGGFFSVAGTANITGGKITVQGAGGPPNMQITGFAAIGGDAAIDVKAVNGGTAAGFFLTNGGAVLQDQATLVTAGNAYFGTYSAGSTTTALTIKDEAVLTVKGPTSRSGDATRALTVGVKFDADPDNIDIADIRIEGGELKLTDNGWSVVSGKTYMAGGKLSIGKDSTDKVQYLAQDDFVMTAGTVKVQGGSTADGEARAFMVGQVVKGSDPEVKANLSVNGGSFTVDKGYAFVNGDTLVGNTGSVVITGGTSDVQYQNEGNFIQSGGTVSVTGGSLASGGDRALHVKGYTTLSAGSFTVDDGSVTTDGVTTVSDSGKLIVKGSTGSQYASAGNFNQTGGTTTISGNDGIAGGPALVVGSSGSNKNLAVSGGTFTLDSGNASVHGTATVSGSDTVFDIKKTGADSKFVASGLFTQSDGTVKVAGGSDTTAALTAAGGALSGGDFKMDGGYAYFNGATTLSGADITLANASQFKAQNAITMSTGSITASGAGENVLKANTMNFSGGAIDVTGKLRYAGTSVANNAFTFSGGTMNVSGSGVVDFVTAQTALTATGGGAINGMLNIVDSLPASGQAGVYATNLTVDSTVTDSNKFTVADMDVALGASSTNGVDVDGALVISGTLSADDNAKVSAIDIGSTGTLTVDMGTFGSASVVDGYLQEYTLNDGLDDVLNGSAGKVILEYDDTAGELTYNDAHLQEIADALGLASANQVVIRGAKKDDKDAVVVTPNHDGTGNVVGVVNVGDDTVNVNVPTDAPPVKEITFDDAVTAGNINLVNGGSVTDVVFDDTSTLYGDGDGAIITGGNTAGGGVVNVTANDSLNLGDATASAVQGGSVGDVTLTGTKTAGTGTSTLDVTDGAYSAGDIVAKDKSNLAGNTVDNNVTVAVGGTKAGASLDADSIDLSLVDDAKIGSVAVGKGTLNVDGDIAFNNNAASGLAAGPGSVVNADSITDASVINVTDGEINAGDIVMNNATSNVMSITDGDIYADSVTNVANLNVNDSGLIVDGTLAFAAGQTAEATITGDGAVVATRVVLGSNDNWVIVGDNTNIGKGELHADTAKMNGGYIFLDPAWNQTGGNDIRAASKVVIGAFDNNIQDGNVIVGQNSYYLYGTMNSSAFEKRVLEAGSWGPNGKNPVTAAVGLYKPLILGTNQSLIVDGELEARPDPLDGNKLRPYKNGGFINMNNYRDTAYFAADSLLVVDAGAVGNGAALTAQSNNGTLTVDEDAKLYVFNARNGQQFKLTEGFNPNNSATGVIGDNAWNPADNLNDSPMVSIDVDGTGADVIVTAQANDARDAYDRISDGAADTLNWIYGVDPNSPGPQNDTSDTAPAGIRFVSRATSSAFNGTDRDWQSASIEGAAQIAALGGAPLNAFNIVRLTSNAVAQRFSFNSGMIGSASDTAFDCQPNNRVSIWGGGLYEHGRVSGMDVGPFEHGYRSNLAGGNVGVDFTFGDNVRVGVMGSFGGGKNKSKSGDFAYTENDFDYQTVRGYAGWSMCNFSLLLDGGFTNVKNKLDQSSFAGGLKATAKVHAWDVGVTAEYKAATGFIDIIPHAGVRYEGINTRGHNVSFASTGEDIMNVGSDTQHLLTIPVGVSLAKNINFCNGWNLSPYADVGARFAVGDRTYKTNTSVVGALDMPRYGYRTKMIDAVAFDGAVGVNVNNGRFFGGVNYNITHSKNQTTHGFWANAGVSF